MTIFEIHQFICPYLLLVMVNNNGTSGQPSHELAAICDSFLYLEMTQAIDTARRLKNRALLLNLSECSHRGTSYALNNYVRTLSPVEAVMFCKSFRIGSGHWDAAVWGLVGVEHIDVIRYIRECSTSLSPRVRWKCYLICLHSNWDFLRDKAIMDIGNKSRIGAVNRPRDSTLGAMAWEYFESVLSRTP